MLVNIPAPWSIWLYDTHGLVMVILLLQSPTLAQPEPEQAGFFNPELELVNSRPQRWAISDHLNKCPSSLIL